MCTIVGQITLTGFNLSHVLVVHTKDWPYANHKWSSTHHYIQHTVGRACQTQVVFHEWCISPQVDLTRSPLLCLHT